MIRIICCFSKKPEFGEVIYYKEETYIVSNVWKEIPHVAFYSLGNLIIDQVPPYKDCSWVVQLEKFEMKDFPGYGFFLFSLENFIYDCKQGLLTNYDGHGYFAFKDKMSTLRICPLDVLKGKIFHHFTHVMWFNR